MGPTRPARRSVLMDTPVPQRRRRRRRRVLLRGVPLLAVAAAAFAGGALVGAESGTGAGAQRDLAERWGGLWSSRDYAGMYALLSDQAQRRTTRRRFERAYERAADTATLASLRAGRAGEPAGGRVALPVQLRTRIFGRIRRSLSLPVVVEGETLAVAWRSDLVFPGMKPGDRLTRRTRLAPRAEIEARNGTRLAGGEDRTSDLGPSVAGLVGALGPIPPAQADAYYARGFPVDARVGVSGLEREFDARLAGTPGGSLRVGGLPVAATQPARGDSVRTTIDPAIQRAAVAALAGRFGGVAALRPRDGEVLALAGVAASAPQPPGSTFKIVTLAGSLASGVAKRSDSYPVQTSATLSGVELENANGEACGGTLEEAFAESCNSVFAPMGAELGAKRLVAAAEAFGFNQEPAIAGAAESTLPPADEIGDDLAVGSSAIGQGKVQATALEMASIAATIGARGRRAEPTLRKGADPKVTRATSARVARTISGYMRSVVSGGTGAAAAIPGVAVAGKTGTAELRTTQGDGEAGISAPDDKTDTDAWFTAFAPAGNPRIAVAVLLVGEGAGGTTAAPVAKLVMQAAL